MDEPTFEFRHPVTQAVLGIYEPVAWAVADPLTGAGAGSILLQANRDNDYRWMRQISETDRSEMTVWVGNSCIWGGFCTGRTWNRLTQRLTVDFAQWEAYLYRNGWRAPFAWSQKSETFLVQDLVAKMNSGVSQRIGYIPIVGPAAVGSTLRDLTVPGGKDYGTILDALGSRDNGFEWRLAMSRASNGTVQKTLETYEPGSSRLSSSYLMLEESDDIPRIGLDEWKEDGSDAAARVWATNQDQPPAQLVGSALDTNFTAAPDYRLMRESWTSWSGVTNVATLNAHARAVLAARNLGISVVPVTIPGGLYDISRYTTGDRARLVISDEWLQYDLPAARILSREIKREESGDIEVSMNVSLTDVIEPQPEATL